MLVALLLALVSTPAYADADPSGYDASWTYGKATTIDHTKVQADLTDFPVLINLSSDTDLTDLANNGEAEEEAEEAAEEAAEAAAELAELVAEAAADGEGGERLSSPAPPAMNLDLTTAIISSSGEFLKSVTVTGADGKLTLVFDKGTRIYCANNKAPQRIVLELGDSLSPPSDAVIIGPIYELSVYTSKYSSTPSPVVISPPATMVLAYDPDELPENTTSVFIAYYDEELGWTRLEPVIDEVAEVGKATVQVSYFDEELGWTRLELFSDFVAEVGKVTAQVSYFTPFAVIAGAGYVEQPEYRFNVTNDNIPPEAQDVIGPCLDTWRGILKAVRANLEARDYQTFMAMYGAEALRP